MRTESSKQLSIVIISSNGKDTALIFVLFGSFFNCLQGLVISNIQIFTLQKSIGLNPTLFKMKFQF